MKILYYLLVASAAILPSGSIYNVNIKMPLAVLCLTAVGIHSVFCGINVFKFYVNLLILALFCLFYSIIGLSNNFYLEDVFSHLNAILSSVVMLLLTDYYFKNRIFTTKDVAGILVLVTLINCIIKVLVQLLVALGLIGVSDFYDLIYDVFNYKFISLEFDYGLRIHMPSDFLIPIAISVLLMGKYLNVDCCICKSIKLLVLVVMVMAAFFTYSRLMWAYVGVVFLLYFFNSWHRLRLKKIFRYVYIFGFLFSVMFLIYQNEIIDFGNLTKDIVEERFFGANANSSDSERNEMYEHLLNEIRNSPILGNGMGGFCSGYIRFREVPWNYELQILSCFMHFGVFGGVIFLVFFFRYILSFRKNKKTNNCLFSLPLSAFWVFVNIFNCFMLTSAGGVVFAFLYTIKEMDNDKLN